MIELVSTAVSGSEAVGKLDVVIMPVVLTTGTVLSVTTFVEDSSIMVEVGASVDDTSVDFSMEDEVESSAFGDVEGSLMDDDPSVLVSISIVETDTDVVSSTSVDMVDSSGTIMVEAIVIGSVLE